MTGILIAGTSSDAGKSLVATGLCRVLRRRGIDVAPFKAQNMSNNSMVCADGGEIGRAQYLQAQAAGVQATCLMNPVLLKPGSDRTSFVVIEGQPAGTLNAGEYAHERPHLAAAAWDAYRRLAAQHEFIVCEGAGSPAEINLRRGDYTNMGLARALDLPVVIVGDIDRGGVLASLFGTWALLEEADRAHLVGYIINKFRGDASILAPGLAEITRRTGMANLGVLPWLPGAWLDGEDTLDVGRWRHHETSTRAAETLQVAVVRLPRMSNATDVDALAHEPGVDVIVTDDPAVCRRADLVVLPGSRSTLSDLAWLRARGLADVLMQRHAEQRPILGICGGFQMLGHRIVDGVENPDDKADGLGLLPHDTVFAAAKVLGRPEGRWRGVRVEGYEIHHGVCERRGAAEDFLDGHRVGQTWGTMWHGTLECDEFRRVWLSHVASATGSSWQVDPSTTGFGERRERMIELVADAVEEHVAVDEVLAVAR